MLIVDTGKAVNRLGRAPARPGARGRAADGGWRIVKRRCGTGFLCAAFGVGLLAATLCPPQLMLVLVAAALVILGCSRAKN